MSALAIGAVRLSWEHHRGAAIASCHDVCDVSTSFFHSLFFGPLAPMGLRRALRSDRPSPLGRARPGRDPDFAHLPRRKRQRFDERDKSATTNMLISEIGAGATL